jgi:hypothetical protein
MTNQEIAKALYEISWAKVQFDEVYENEKVAYLLSRIEKLSKEEGLRLILHVLSVKSLALETDFKKENNPFSDMVNFNYMDTHVNEYPTDNYRNIP